MKRAIAKLWCFLVGHSIERKNDPPQLIEVHCRRVWGVVETRQVPGFVRTDRCSRCAHVAYGVVFTPHAPAPPEGWA